MASSIIFSLNAVLPLVILILLGFCLKQEKLGLFAEPKAFFNQVDRLVFHVALPVYIFNDLAEAKMEEIFDAKLVLYCVGGILLSFLLLVFIVPLFIKQKASRGAFIQGIYRSNFAILGVPLAGNLFEGVGSRTAALVLPFAVSLFNILAVVILSINAPSPEDAQSKGSVGKIALGVIKNPLIIAIIIAVPFMLFKITLPALLQKSVNYVASMSTPLALVSLGAGIDLRVLKSKARLAFAASAIRTALSPLLFVIPAALLGFRDSALVVIFVLFAAPTAVSSFIMAKNMKSDYELAGQIVVLTTAICPVTVFLGSFILKSMGLI